MLHVTLRHVAAEVGSVLVIVHDNVDRVVVGVHRGHVQRSPAGATRVDRELRPLVDRHAGPLQSGTGRLHLGRIEVGRHRADLGHVGRLRYVGFVAQNVDGVLAGRSRPVGNVGRAVAVVLAVNLRLRRTLD